MNKTIAEEFNQKFYTVYNVIKNNRSEFYLLNKIYELYSILINSEHVVTIEEHKSIDNLILELRVIFWNKQSYDDWAKENRKKYDEIVKSFTKVNDSEFIIFERYTSLEGYTSQFPYTIYPDKNSLFNWTLIPYHKNFVIKDICPLGKIQEYTGNGNFNLAANIKDYGARFIKERTSEIIRRPPSQQATKTGNFPRIVAYSFEQSIQTLMYTAPWLYRKLTKLTYDVEQLASKYILDCDNAAVLIGHNSMGQELTLHTHRLSDELRYSFTIITRLTFEDKGAFVKFYDPIKDDDPNLSLYYSNPLLLIDSVKNDISKGFNLESRASMLVFSASYIPHLVMYDNDIYLFYVYDNVTFKPGMFELIVQNSHIKYFEKESVDKRLCYQLIA